MDSKQFSTTQPQSCLPDPGNQLSMTINQLDTQIMTTQGQYRNHLDRDTQQTKTSRQTAYSTSTMETEIAEASYPEYSFSQPASQPTFTLNHPFDQPKQMNPRVYIQPSPQTPFNHKQEILTCGKNFQPAELLNQLELIVCRTS
jgi:hypothetical protein